MCYRICSLGRLARKAALLLGLALYMAAPAQAADTVLRYFPSGMIYEYRWKLLELALQRSPGLGPVRLQAASEDLTQSRASLLLQSGDIDVVAFGTNPEREDELLPIKIDILRGIVGYRLLIIRAEDQARIEKMPASKLRKELAFGLNSQWADLPIMQANGYTVRTASGYDNLFAMLDARRFDAFPRGLNEAQRELEQQSSKYPQLRLERSKALYFPYPVYFWVSKKNTVLAMRIAQGLKRALADGSFRRLFEHYHAKEIESLKAERRTVVPLSNPLLPAAEVPDTSWWWTPHEAESPTPLRENPRLP